MALSSPEAASCEPALKPNHPTHNMKTPNAPKAKLCPGMTFDLPEAEYLPSLGPTTIAPANATHAPTECTTVEPAKSWNPISDNQPPPQIQCPEIG